jgi:hypothetical protein
LNRAVKAGTESVSILKRLAELEAKAGNAAAAERHLAAARRLAQP